MAAWWPAGLDEAGLAHGVVRVISSPRRLAALVADVAAATEEIHEVKRGPAAQIAFDAGRQPHQGRRGFARKCGVAASELVRRQDADGREYVFAERYIPSAPAEPILSALCEKTIAGLEWPNYRSQRWGSTHETFVRPIRWLCVLFGGDVVPVRYADVVSGNTTRGHRVLGPASTWLPSRPHTSRCLRRRACSPRSAGARLSPRASRASKPSARACRVDTPRRCSTRW